MKLGWVVVVNVEENIYLGKLGLGRIFWILTIHVQDCPHRLSWLQYQHRSKIYTWANASNLTKQKYMTELSKLVDIKMSMLINIPVIYFLLAIIFLVSKIFFILSKVIIVKFVLLLNFSIKVVRKFFFFMMFVLPSKSSSQRHWQRDLKSMRCQCICVEV